MKVALAAFVLAILSAFICEVYSQCSENHLGNVQCVLLTPYYSVPQWATCLTDTYIRERSNGDHVCRNFATICWYQCQIEVHGNAQGVVFDDCQCSMEENVPTNAPDLDPSCYSPSGDSCDWYQQCLEERYQCEGTEHDYAIRFAERFCNLYNTIDVSSTGQRWVNSVRKCLQMSLVPLLRPWVQTTCSEIRTMAFQTHTPCYLSPESQAPSICDLPVRDCLKIFWLIFSNIEFNSAIVETGSQMLQVANGCTQQEGINKAKVGKTILLSFPAAQVLKLVRAGQFTLTKFTITVGSYLSNLLNFDTKSISWFPPEPEEPADTTSSPVQRRNAETEEQNFNITLLLVSLDSLGITTQATGQTYEIEEVVDEIANAVSSGQLSNIPISDGETINVVSVGECEDLLCSEGTNVTTLAVANDATQPLSTRALAGIVVGVVCGLIGIMLCVVCIVYVLSKRKAEIV